MSTLPAISIVPSLTLTPNEVRFYQEEGYLYLPGLVSETDAARLRREVMEIMNLIGLPLTKLKQTSEYLSGSAIDALVNSPSLLGIASQLMSGTSLLYLPFTAVKSAGGGGRFHFHQDNQYTTFDGLGINIWVALNPMTPENGCLQIIPRSHLQGTLPSAESPDHDGHRQITYEPEQFLPIRMRAGDAVAFSRTTVHGSGPNTTDEHRVGYAVQYARDNVRYQKDGEWVFVKEHPRWSVGPVKAITLPKSGLDGH